MDYLIIPSTAIGGSEIRLISCWILMRRLNIKSGIKIVISKEVYELLRGREDIFNSLQELRHDVIIEEFPTTFLDLQNKLHYLLKFIYSDAKSIIILLNTPVFYKKRKGQKLIYIHPGTTLFSNSNYKGILGQLISVFKADKVDVLDPDVYNLFRKLFFFNRGKFHTTQFGISSAHMLIPRNIIYEKKKNQIIYLGSLIRLKQIEELVNSLEFVHERLVSNKVFDYEFIIIGKGPLQPIIDTKLAVLQDMGVNVKRVESYSPYSFLYNAKVILSLQLVTNYPSQSLIEGILCGCLPIVTDCGDSKRIADPAFSFYVNEHFTKEELAAKCVRILTMTDSEYKAFSSRGINYILNEFSPETMALYYTNLLN